MHYKNVCYFQNFNKFKKDTILKIPENMLLFAKSLKTVNRRRIYLYFL